MTYQDFISLVGREVLDRRAWPSDGTKLQEQIDLAYVSGLAVATELPLTRFTLSIAPLTLQSVVPSSTTETYLFPGSIFSERQDLGVNAIIINGKDVFLSESVPVSSVYQAGENEFQSTENLFSVDLAGRKVYVNNATTVGMSHFPRPVKPTTGNYTSADYFIPTKDAQRAVHVVSSHVSGSRIRDNAAATFQSMLEQYYGRT